MRLKARYTALLSALMLALGALIVPLSSPAALASGNPVLVCSQTTDGAHTSYTFPADCNTTVTSLLPSGYDTLEIDYQAKCTSNSFFESYIKVNFNGDFGFNYDYAYRDTVHSPTSTNTQPYLILGQVPCDESPTPADARASTELIIPFASSSTLNKNVIAHTATSEWFPSVSETLTYDTIGSGTWHRTSVGAITIIEFRTTNGGFDAGTTFDIYAY